MMRCRDINAVLNHCKSALDTETFTKTDKMVSKVITERICNYIYAQWGKTLTSC